MDYEKKYNEILAWAKKYKARLNGVPIEDIFPELRESEDERIRKALLGLTYIDGIEPILTKCSITAGDIRAWLENQKENPKSADSISADCVSSAKCEDRWHKTANSLPDSGRDVLAKDALGNYLLASFDGAQWFVSVYDGQDHPVLHTPPILEWCDIPSEKQKEPENTSASTMIPSCWECEQKEQKPCGCVNVESEYDKGWRDGHKAGLKDAEMQKPNYCHYGGDPNIERCKYCSAACIGRLTK